MGELHVCDQCHAWVTQCVHDTNHMPPAVYQESLAALEGPQRKLQQLLLATYPVGVRKPGGITIQEAADLWHVDYTTARSRLQRMVSQAALYRELVVANGRSAWVYYQAAGMKRYPEEDE